MFPDKTVFALDTYEGIPKNRFSPEHGDHDEPGKFKPRYAPENMFPDHSNIVPVIGDFADTGDLLSEELSLVFLDCDLYHSYRQAQEVIYPRLRPGSVVIVDDYLVCKGAKLAMDEWMRDWDLHWQSDHNGEVIIWP